MTGKPIKDVQNWPKPCITYLASKASNRSQNDQVPTTSQEETSVVSSPNDQRTTKRASIPETTNVQPATRNRKKTTSVMITNQKSVSALDENQSSTSSVISQPTDEVPTTTPAVITGSTKLSYDHDSSLQFDPKLPGIVADAV